MQSCLSSGLLLFFVKVTINTGAPHERQSDTGRLRSDRLQFPRRDQMVQQEKDRGHVGIMQRLPAGPPAIRPHVQPHGANAKNAKMVRQAINLQLGRSRQENR